jgi:hypothetical protein
MRFLSLLALLFVLAASPLDAQTRVTVASDDFNRTEDPLSNGGVWRKIATSGPPGFEANGTVAVPDNAPSAEFHYMVHDATLQNDQWSQATFSNVAANSQIGLMVRWAAFETNTGYLAVITDGGTTSLLRRLAGETDLLVSDGLDTPSGATYRFEAVGTALTLYRNDVNILSTTDANIASGVGGILGTAGDQATDVSHENFSVGNFGGASRRAVVSE